MARRRKDRWRGPLLAGLEWEECLRRWEEFPPRERAAAEEALAEMMLRAAEEWGDEGSGEDPAASS